MSFLRGAPALLASLLVFVTAQRAQADGAKCTTAAEDGQRARAAGQLRTAHRQFLECSTEECPALVRRDCAQWASAVAEMMPSIIVDARDAAGHDVGDVAVSIDGEVVARTLDGKGIPIDPGPHTLAFARAGSPTVTEKVIIKEGARGRTFVVKFAGDGAVPATPASDVTSPGEAPRGHSWPPWVLIGVGGVVIVAGVVYVVTTPSLPAGCIAATETCQKFQGETTAEFATRQDQAGSHVKQPTVGAVVIGVGAAILAGGVLWHFLESTGPEPAKSKPSARLVPWTTADGGGLAAMGRF